MAVQTTEEFKDGGATSYAITIEYLQASDIKVRINGALQTYVTSSPGSGQYTVSGTTVTLGAQAASGTGNVHIYRETDVNTPAAVFSVGSAIRAQDLNAIHDMGRFAAVEHRNKIINADIRTGAVTSDSILDGTIVNDDINTNAGIENTKLADGLLKSGLTVNSANIVNGSIVDEDINNNANIQGSKLLNDSVTLDKLGAGTLPNDIVVTRDNIQNGTIQDADIETGTLDNRYYTETELNNGQLNNVYYTETELDNGQLDNRYYTETELTNGALDGRYYTETESENLFLRQDSTETISSGDTWSGTDAKVATTAAIDLRIIDLVDDVGGFVPIADELNFPDANPDINSPDGYGTIVSIKSIDTSRTPSGGTVSITNGNVSSNATITITGCGSTVLPAGYGVLVETTPTLHTYRFHRLTPKATEVSTVAANAVNISAAGANVVDINNFADRYQIGTSAPTQRADNSNLVVGDLWFDSSSNKVMMVYDASSGDGFSAVTPNSSDLAAIRIVSGQITFTEDLGLITEALTTGTGNTTLNTVAGISSDVTAVAGNAANINAVAADATDIGAVAGKATEIGRLGTADAVADMNTLGTTAIVSDMDTLADISSNITTVAGVSSNVTTVAGISSDVTAVAGNATNISAVAADATDIGAVAGKATEIGRLGTADAVADLAILGTTDVVADLNTLATSAIVSDMDTLADISSDITTVAGISSNVTTVAGNNANVSAVAGNNTNITAVASNSSNINAAVSNASNINSAVSNATNINTVAGISSNVTTVAGISSNVTTVANDGTDIGLVAGSISNVNTVAGSISDVNTFANRYRIASSAPSTSLDAGDLYFDTSLNELRVYNGSTWQGGVTATGSLAGLTSNTFTGDQTVNANITASGTLKTTGNAVIIEGADPKILLTDTNNDSDFRILNENGVFKVYDQTNNATRFSINSNATTVIAGNTDFGAGIDVTGNITVSGTVDGVDVAALKTAKDSLSTTNGALVNGVTATTQAQSDNSTKVSTTAYVRTAISNLVDSSPSTLDTLNELAAALGDDANFSTTVTNSIATKAPLASPTFTGTVTAGTITGNNLQLDFGTIA